MNLQEFQRRLVGELCWADGHPTHRSSALQRQCRVCRRKWSYARMQTAWDLARSYCADHTRDSAANAAGCDPHTAGKYFEKFDAALAPHFRAIWERDEWGTLGEAPAKTRSFATIRPRQTPKQKHRLAVEIAFDRMNVEARLDLLYRVYFLTSFKPVDRNPRGYQSSPR